jgi:hypothetical protein
MSKEVSRSNNKDGTVTQQTKYTKSDGSEKVHTHRYKPGIVNKTVSYSEKTNPPKRK